MVEKFVGEGAKTAADAATPEECALSEPERLTGHKADLLLYGAKPLPRDWAFTGVLKVPKRGQATFDEFLQTISHTCMERVIDVAQTQYHHFDLGDLRG